MGSHVFISYSRSDRPYVEKLAAHLQSAGIEIWFDYQMVSGDRFDDVLAERIESAAAVIVILTPDSVESRWVRRELHHADVHDVPVFPLMLVHCPMPIILAGVQREEVRSGALPDGAFVRQLVDVTGRANRPADAAPQSTPLSPAVGTEPRTPDDDPLRPDVCRAVIAHFERSMSTGEARHSVDLGAAGVDSAMLMVPYVATIDFINCSSAVQDWLSGPEDAVPPNLTPTVLAAYFERAVRLAQITDPFSRIRLCARTSASLSAADGQYNLGTMFLSTGSPSVHSDDFRTLVRSFLNLLAPGAPFAIAWPGPGGIPTSALGVIYTLATLYDPSIRGKPKLAVVTGWRR